MPGHFVTNSGEKINCEIYYEDWLYNPQSFIYRKDKDQAQITIKTKEIKELLIDNKAKYINSIVKIDKSSDEMEQINTIPDPLLTEDTILLKVLLEGKANLYQYVAKTFVHYFIKIDTLPIEQLIYKRYFLGPSNIKTNTSFRQQLMVYLDCKNINKAVFEYLNHNETELKKIVAKYNKCIDPSNNVKISKSFKVSLNIRPGINNQSLKFSSTSLRNVNFNLGTNTNFRIGTELEVFLPTNNQKWSLIFEPTYRFFKGSSTTVKPSTFGADEIQKVSCEYSSIEFASGLRYRFYVNDNVNVFLNATYLFEKTLQATVAFEDGAKIDLKFVQRPNLGIGVSIFKKFSAELRFRGNNRIRDLSNIKANYSSISLILGYRLF